MRQLLCRKGKGSGQCATLHMDFLPLVLTSAPQHLPVPKYSVDLREQLLLPWDTVDTGHLLQGQ